MLEHIKQRLGISPEDTSQDVLIQDILQDVWRNYTSWLGYQLSAKPSLEYRVPAEESYETGNTVDLIKQAMVEICEYGSSLNHPGNDEAWRVMSTLDTCLERTPPEDIEDVECFILICDLPPVTSRQLHCTPQVRWFFTVTDHVSLQRDVRLYFTHTDLSLEQGLDVSIRAGGEQVRADLSPKNKQRLAAAVRKRLYLPADDKWTQTRKGRQTWVNDAIAQLCLYLIQKELVDLNEDASVQKFLWAYLQRFRGTKDLGAHRVLEKIRECYQIPENYRAWRKYVSRTIRGLCANQERQDSSDVNAGDEVALSPEQAEAAQQRKRQGRSWKRKQPVFPSSEQLYSVDEALRDIRAEGVGELKHRTLYNWINKGHRWYGKVDAIRDTSGQLRITDQGLAQVRMMVYAENRCDRLRNSPGMTAANLKKLYQRHRKPDRTPDLDAIEDHMAGCRHKAQDQEPLEETLSIEDQIAVLEVYLAGEEVGSDTWCDAQDALQSLRRIQEGSHPS